MSINITTEAEAKVSAVYDEHIFLYKPYMTTITTFVLLLAYAAILTVEE